jgi:CHAT domain-containing protein/tetratricopeptide (TPR) repeat protein
VIAALRAVDADTAGRLAAQWKSRVAHDSSDRSALLGLATLARLQYDYPTAERFYRQLLRGENDPKDRVRVYARLGEAEGLDAQGWTAKAGPAFTEARSAAAVAGDSAAQGEALLGISLQRAFGVGIEAGLATLDTADGLIPANRNDLHAERLRQRGALRGIVGRPEARADVAHAIVLARSSGTQRVLGQALKSFAQVLQFEGKRDSSVLVLRQAEEAYRRGHDRAQLSTALLWHVNALLGQGQLGEASELAHLALTEAQAASNLFGVGAAYTALGALNLSLNDYSAAADYLDKSVTLFQRVGDRAGEIKARDYLAVTALAAGDIAEARRQTQAALDWYRQTGEALIEFSEHRNLAIIAMHERNWPAAERALADAHALARRMNRPLWSAELSYDDGRLALFRGNAAAAERDFKTYLATLDTSQHVFRHDARVRLSDAYARQDNLAKAEREAGAAWDELDRWRASLSNADLRVLAFQASPTEMSDRDASVVSLLSALARGGHSNAAFELAERRRARELADRLAQAQGLHRGAPVNEADTASAGSHVGAAAVIAGIPDDSTAILEYVTGSLGAPTTLFVLTRGTAPRSGPEVVLLPPVDSLSGQILRLEALVQSGDSTGPLGRTLGETLLQPAASRLNPAIRRLVIIPDGLLHRLPFDILRLGDGRYAAERYAISLAPSAAVLLTLWKERSGSADRPMRLLAFGDPAFRPTTLDDSGSDARTSRRAGVEGPLPRLRRSADEARLVARFSPASVVRLRQDASAAYLKHAELTPFRVIHFATHTLVDEHSAARSALVLAPGGGESGLVGPEELAALRFNADLVVLSSCRSAGGVVVNGEGLQGLTAPLVQAGARSVLASQWEVGDRDALEVIRSFYRHVAEGQTVGEALRRAKVDGIARGTPPREWAAFTMIGDPLVHVPLRAPRRAYWPFLLGLAAAALVFFYWLRIRSRRSGELR